MATGDAERFELEKEVGERAETAVRRRFKRYGIHAARWGVEHLAKEQKQARDKQHAATKNDPKWWRDWGRIEQHLQYEEDQHRPDLILCWDTPVPEPLSPPIYVQVKSRAKPSPLHAYSIDVGAFRGAWYQYERYQHRWLSPNMPRLMVAFVDLASQDRPLKPIQCCWLQQLFDKPTIGLPSPWLADKVAPEDVQRLSEGKLTGLERATIGPLVNELLHFTFCDYRVLKSGRNPLVLVHDTAPYLQLFDDFMQKELGLQRVTV